jgi:hypothetical protein
MYNIGYMVFPVANPSADQSASVAELRRQISLALEQKLTGTAKIVFLTGEEMTLFVRNGNIRQVYYKDGHVSRVLPDAWESPDLSNKRARLSIRPVPARWLLFEKIALESDEAAQEKEQGFKTSAMAQLFATMNDREAGSLVHIQWQGAEAFVLVPGSKLALRPALFLSGEIAEEDADAISSIENWKETACNLTIYRGGLGSEAWLEVQLDILFESFCNYLLTQYGYLTGRVMITSIIQNMMILAAQNGWDVHRCGDMVVDRTIFASPKEAAFAYHELLEMMMVHMGAVIGSGLVQSVRRQGMDSYNSFYLSLIKTYELI